MPDNNQTDDRIEPGAPDPTNGDYHRDAGDRAFWLTLAVVAALAIIVTLFAAQKQPFPGDIALLAAVQALRNPVLDPIMVFVTDIGYVLSSLAVVALASVILWALGLRLAAVFTFLTPLGDLVTTSLKVVIGRPRPPEQFLYLIGPPIDFGYPSGHALHAALFYGFLIFVSWHYVKGRRVKIGLTIVLVLLALLTGLSRVYLGAHWPSDVLGGYLIGIVLLLGWIWLFRWAEAHTNEGNR